jgi:hypothetical protein
MRQAWNDLPLVMMTIGHGAPSDGCSQGKLLSLGVFAGGAGLEQMTEEEGKADILKLDMAKNGHCDSKP